MTGTSLSSIEGRRWEGRKDGVILVAIVIFALFFRLATLMMMNTGVDERDYWFSAKAMANGLPYPEITHRTSRFAIILPVALAQVILGSHPDVYYVLPVANAMLQAGLAYVLGLRLRGRLTGFLAALGLTLFPYMIRAGSQVRPEVFSITYMLVVFLFFLEYLKRDSHELAPLLWSAGFLFIAYEAKITNLFFAPGLFLAVLLYKRKPGHAFLFAGVLLFLFLAETGLYAMFSKYKLGELEVIAENHFHPDSTTVPGVLDLFQRFASPNLQAYWQVVFVLFGIAAVVYLARGKDIRVSSLVIGSLSFFLFITFEVKSLHPVMPAESFINRYFCAVLPSVFLVLAYAAEGVGHRLKLKLGDSPASFLTVLAILVVAVLVVFSFPRLPTGLRQYANSPLHPRQHPLILNEAYRQEINAALAKGTAIVAVDDNGGDNAIQTCESFFIDLAYYRNGRPPGHSAVLINDLHYLVLSEENAGTTTGQVLAAIRAPFRVVSMSASNLRLLTNDSVVGTRGPADEDTNQ